MPARRSTLIGLEPGGTGLKDELEKEDVGCAGTQGESPFTHPMDGAEDLTAVDTTKP